MQASISRAHVCTIYVKDICFKILKIIKINGSIRRHRLYMEGCKHPLGAPKKNLQDLKMLCTARKTAGIATCLIRANYCSSQRNTTLVETDLPSLDV